MTAIDARKAQARDWFEALRTRICAAFEAIEREAGSDAAFDYIAWDREGEGVTPGPIEEGGGGGGVRGVMKGKVFEKVGVNVSTVGGTFSPEFAKQINGAGEDPRFFATGISLVAHMANPHVPAVHMNTRFLVTTKCWFGGGADLNPPIPYEEDTRAFHARLRAACAPFGPDVYERYAKWADDYFFIPHRGVARGVGGIFYDHLESDSDTLFERNFAFTRAVGEAFLDAYPPIVRRRMHMQFSEADIHAQRVWRGRYAEFNLVHDRGTLFGLKTGGNIDAILMSLPPLAAWD
jgi:coproporphyrinogen III oxidase